MFDIDNFSVGISTLGGANSNISNSTTNTNTIL